MRKIIALLTVCAAVICALIATGCEKSTGVADDYNTPDMSFKGLNMECVSENDKFTIVRNNMVYTDFGEFVKEDLNSKGNKIKSIKVTESTADVFHDDQTVATMAVEIESDGGDIKSGEYNIAAYFTYDISDMADAKMYLINYCFVPDYKLYPDLFEESYNKINK